MSKISLLMNFSFAFFLVMALTLNFRPVEAIGPIYIRADGTVDPQSAPISRDGNLYTLTANITSETGGIVIERSNVSIDGNGHSVSGGASGYGFYLSSVTNVEIRNTRIEGFTYGVYLESSSYIRISRNTIRMSTYDGITLYDSFSNEVSLNEVGATNWFGVGLYYSTNNNITANTISDNYNGIGILLYSSDNRISRNSITNNHIGIELSSSSNNSIYNNQFANNDTQAYIESSANTWDIDYPSGGNYWSNYSGTDLYSGPFQNETGSDGIGDTWHAIGPGNIDRYPLMPPDITVSDMVNAKTIVGQGFPLDINVTLTNQGARTESFNLTVYANSTLIWTESIALLGGETTTVASVWDTSSFAKGDYRMSACVEPLLGETNIADNVLVGSAIYLGVPGDINGDGLVEMMDFFMASLSFNSFPGHPRWDPNADINNDQMVEMMDFFIMSQHYGEHFP